MTSYREFDVPEVILSQEVPLSVDPTMFPEEPTATNTPELEEEEVVSSVVVVVLSVLFEPSSLLQEMTVKLKRNMESMISICLIRFPIGGLGETKLYQNMGEFTRIGDFTWRVSDCEELSGGYLKTV